jgi:hypothetical protein
MTNRFDRAAARLDARLSGFASSLVTYTRPSTNQSVSILATPGRTPYEIDTGAGVLVPYESKDFIVSVADLILAGSPAVPQVDDTITSNGKTYTVADLGSAASGGMMKCYQSVALNLRYRIHTKVTGASS